MKTWNWSLSPTFINPSSLSWIDRTPSHRLPPLTRPLPNSQHPLWMTMPRNTNLSKLSTLKSHNNKTSKWQWLIKTLTHVKLTIVNKAKSTQKMVVRSLTFNPLFLLWIRASYQVVESIVHLAKTHLNLLKTLIELIQVFKCLRLPSNKRWE